MKRRQILSAVGSGSIIGLSGCSSVFNNDITLGPVSLLNRSDEKTSIQVQVEYNQEVVEDSVHDVEPNEAASIECAWPEEPGEFLVRLKRENGEWDEEDFSDHETDCAFVDAWVHQDGTIRFGVGDCFDEMC